MSTDKNTATWHATFCNGMVVQIRVEVIDSPAPMGLPPRIDSPRPSFVASAASYDVGTCDSVESAFMAAYGLASSVAAKANTAVAEVMSPATLARVVDLERRLGEAAVEQRVDGLVADLRAAEQGREVAQVALSIVRSQRDAVEMSLAQSRVAHAARPDIDRLASDIESLRPVGHPWHDALALAARTVRGAVRP